MKKPTKLPVLEKLASEIVGDGKSPNLYFVTDRGTVITVTTRRSEARAQWEQLSRRSPLVECALEDRSGVLASVEPESDAPNARLVCYADR